MTNPLLEPWNGPHGLPPFEATRAEHFEPAFEVALAAHRAEIDAIVADPAAPDIENTVRAFDRSGRLLGRIKALFFNLSSSETSTALQAVETRIAPRLAAHYSSVALNRALFERFDRLARERRALVPDDEDARALDRFHLDFLRAGARLEGAARQRYAQIVERLALLHTRFGQNVLADEAAFRLVLSEEANAPAPGAAADDAAGLPAFVRAAMKQAALERGIEAGLVVTLSRSHIVPFLTFSERRDLREVAWRAWTARGEHPGANDNRAIAREILALRNEQARLLGHASYADHVLADSMAGSQAAVEALLTRVWEPAKCRLADELEVLQKVAAASGEAAPIAPWDWRFYAEKLRRERYALDEAEVKPYFPLERMVEALFDVAGRLFGLRFEPKPELRAYHPDVRIYEVFGPGDAPVGLFLHDNFARPTKRSGAWMDVFRDQSRSAGVDVLPIVINNNNFARGAPGAPTLLSFDDATTLFHEFGHGLHGLLSNVTYQRLAGTNVLNDFVELPSQLFEHWLAEPEVLKRHARHHLTAEAIPDALIAKLHEARHFNQGYETVRYTASALVDMAAHALTDPEAADVVAFEATELVRIGAPTVAGLNHRLTHFQHLFAGSGYAAGYYVYLWAEVLDADGYEAFSEAGDPFDPALAERLRRYVYSSGATLEPGAAYRAFRGREPRIEPMLKQRGLVTA